MSRLIASVPPLDTPFVLKYASTCCRHCRGVRPRRAISGTGQLRQVSMMLIAMRRPSTGSVAR
jgi:hypothetical protein